MPPHPRGFTLIEVLVALVVLAITGGFAYRTMFGALLSLTETANDQSALVLAQSILDRVGRDIDLRPGNTDGNTTDGFLWRLTMTSDTTTPSSSPLRPIVVNVSVGWTNHHRARQVHLSTLRLAANGPN